MKERLTQLNILGETDHELRVALDYEIEKMTGQYCDEGVKGLSDSELRSLVSMLLERKRKKKVGQALGVDLEQTEVVNVGAYA